MDDEYILDKLKRWVPLFYGSDKTDVKAFVVREGSRDFYCFGYKSKEDMLVLNKLTKAVAIFLALNVIDPDSEQIDSTKKIKRCRGSHVNTGTIG